VHKYNKNTFKMDVRVKDGLERSTTAVNASFSMPMWPSQAAGALQSKLQKSKNIEFSYRDPKGKKARKCKKQFFRKSEWNDNYYCTLCKVEISTEEGLVNHFNDLNDIQKAEHHKNK
jgi:hypothetical protein